MHDNYIIAKDVNHKIFMSFLHFSLLIISTLKMYYTVFTVSTLLFMDKSFMNLMNFETFVEIKFSTTLMSCKLSEATCQQL